MHNVNSTIYTLWSLSMQYIMYTINSLYIYRHKHYYIHYTILYYTGDVLQRNRHVVPTRQQPHLRNRHWHENMATGPSTAATTVQ